MAKEFKTLSEKIILVNVERGDRYHPMIDFKDLKEFIKRERKIIDNLGPANLSSSLNVFVSDQSLKCALTNK